LTTDNEPLGAGDFALGLSNCWAMLITMNGIATDVQIMAMAVMAKKSLNIYYVLLS